MRLSQLRSAAAAGVVGAFLAVPVTADAVQTRVFTNHDDATIGLGAGQQFNRNVNVSIPANERVIDVDALVRARHNQANDNDWALIWPNYPGQALTSSQRAIMLLSDPGTNAADWGPNDGNTLHTIEFDQQSELSIFCGHTGDYTLPDVRPGDCDPGDGGDVNDGVNDSFLNGFVPQNTTLNVLGTPGAQQPPRNGTWVFQIKDDTSNGINGALDFVRLQITTTEPTAQITSSPNPSTAGECVQVTDGNSAADPGVPGAVITQREYDLDGNGTFETGGNSDTQTACFNAPGSYTLSIRVTQTGGATQTASRVQNVVAPENSARCTTGGSVFNGSEGPDAFTGGAGQDRIFGNGGEDQLNGAGGADCVNGGADADNVAGGNGGDTLIGGTGGDKISDTGGAGDVDLVFGGDGDDAVNVEDGDGDDFVDCGEGNDIAAVDPGDRTVNCEQVI